MGKVNQPSDVISELREIKRRLVDLSKRVGLSSAVISRGGLKIIDGGELVLEDENGVEIVRIGKVTFGAGTSSGWEYRFDTDVVAFRLGGSIGSQAWTLNDSQGVEIVSNDAASGHGLARPSLNYRLIPAPGAEFVGEGIGSGWPSTTATSATKLMQGVNRVWHPRVSIGVATLNTGGATELWRLEVNGTDATGTQSGSDSLTVEIPGWGSTINPGDVAGFDLYGWRSGGTRAWFQCDRLYGDQS